MTHTSSLTLFTKRCFKFWNAELKREPKVYHVNGELNLTLMAEDAINTLGLNLTEKEYVHEASVDFVMNTNWY